MYDGRILIMGFNIENSVGSPNYKQIQNNFPAELDLCGLIKFGECTDAQAHLNEIIQDVDVTDNPVLLHCEIGTSNVRASLFMHGHLEDIQFDIMEEETLWNEFIYARVQCNLEVVCPEDEKSVKASMQNLRKYVASGKTGFKIVNSPIYLIGRESGTCITGTKSNAKVFDLIEAANSVSTDDIQSKKKVARTDFEVLRVALFMKLSGDQEFDKISNNAAKCVFKPDVVKIRIPLQIDSLAVLHKNTKALGLYDILIESVCRSIRLIEKSVANQKFLSNINDLGVPKTFNFKPNELGHFFSCVYLTNSIDEDEYLVKRRKRLHQQFALPLTRPQFKRTNRYLFDGEQPTMKHLVNPHVGLKSQVTGGTQYLVTGKYTYYHYMQDGFDDNGWGCAYRSLQTLSSWYQWQGYVERDVPSHKEIQKYLFDIGDKPSSFVGSKQWIGSTEVSMVLDGLFHIVSRILRVESGADLSQHGPTLARHFETQGTPIMIGGGVLAHTILGVDFNSTTNDLKFLILDPHYTGADDLSIVQAKKWCGWKGIDFWDKKSYYNLCMPQLPINTCC
ncbi:hypothetical protein HA402_007086 [Bradysia odoriphaga]|nr:hypothetical protein HA402_007086 [Bradysia odoriphaga]